MKSSGGTCQKLCSLVSHHPLTEVYFLLGIIVDPSLLFEVYEERWFIVPWSCFILLSLGFWSNNCLFENLDEVILIDHVVSVPDTLQVVYNAVLKTKPNK